MSRAPTLPEDVGQPARPAAARIAIWLITLYALVGPGILLFSIAVAAPLVGPPNPFVTLSAIVPSAIAMVLQFGLRRRALIAYIASLVGIGYLVWIATLTFDMTTTGETGLFFVGLYCLKLAIAVSLVVSWRYFLRRRGATPESDA
jgi:hypothetical protein